MPSCAVPDCYGKGTFHKFPRNEKKRKLWTKMINRSNWEPTESSVLCEVHFAEDAWEKIRVDGKKKLKTSALPTLFFDTFPKKPKITSILKTGSLTINKNEGIYLSNPRTSSKKKVLIPTTEETEDEIILFDPDSEEIPLFDPESEEILFDPDSEEIPLFDPHDYAMASEEKKEENLDSETFMVREIPEENEEIEYEEKLSSEQKIHERDLQGLPDLQRETSLEDSETILENTEKARISLRKQVRSLRTRLRHLEEIRDESKVLLRLKTIFNDDQLLTLVRENGKVTWSDKTLEKALKLRVTCGEAGYTELLRQNMPLPCSRSLRRALKLPKFTQKFSKELVEYLQKEFGKADELLMTLKKKKPGRRSCFDAMFDS